MSLIKKKQSEEPIYDIQFNIYKFTKRVKPTNKSKILVISCFSEFGCEVMGAMYCVSRLVKENPDAYIIVMGWYGRSYLYKHLVDEFWEVKEEFQFLRDKAMAFHNVSKNIVKVEKYAENFGKVISSYRLGSMAVGSNCKQCDHIWGETGEYTRCPKCLSLDIVKSLFSDIKYWKQTKVDIPLPSAEKMAEADKYLTRNNEFRPIALVARNRTTYGRNLQPEFYAKLIERLEQLHYKPIWLGEKQSTLACPVPHIIDFSRMPESRDLELTLAIVAKCEFTVQFWTASTRLAAMVDTPYLIFESPDQLFGQGQEGYRMALTTSGKKKLALCHFLNVYNDNDSAIDLVESCIKEMRCGNWEDVIGMVDEPDVVSAIRQQNLHRLAGI